MIPPHRNEESLRSWRWIAQVYVWLSVAICILAAFSLGMFSQAENAKLVGAGLLVFAGIGAAFARALPNIQNARWWHWALGALLISPAVLLVF